MEQGIQCFPSLPHATGFIMLGLFCLAPVPAFAQPQDLATTDDGSVIYFSSPLRLKGSAELTNSKIFKYANGVYDLVAQPAPAVTLSGGGVINFDYRLPNVSGDGGILAYDGTASCHLVAVCPESVLATHGFVSGAQLPAAMTASGSLRISHNGRFALRFGSSAPSFTPTQFYDLQTGTLSNVSGNVLGDGRLAVSDDGTIFTSEGLWHNGQINALITAHTPLIAHLSADGTTVVYESAVNVVLVAGGGFMHLWNYDDLLYAYNPANGTEVQLDQSPRLEFVTGSPFFQPPPYFSISVSNDGHRVLYRTSATINAAPQAILANIDGTGRRVLTVENSGIKETVLSGDGHHAYAVTGAGGLLSINVDSGDIQRLLSDAPPLIDQVFQAVPRGPAVVPGSQIVLNGQSLAKAAGQSNVSVAGYSAPVLAASPQAVTLQVPWELDLNSPTTFIAADPTSPFEQAISVQPVPAAPEFLAVAHQDFRGAPTASDPAHPAEVLAFYMTGLGPVSPPVATGQRAPLDTLSYAQLPLICQWNPFENGLGAEILFAGLAPGEFGVYQVNIRVPASIDHAQLGCSSLLPSGSQSNGALISVPLTTR
jgi:uncharacterized protein (TIGR03437 family)